MRFLEPSSPTLVINLTRMIVGGADVRGMSVKISLRSQKSDGLILVQVQAIFQELKDSPAFPRLKILPCSGAGIRMDQERETSLLSPAEFPPVQAGQSLIGFPEET